ncbi:hypothetical protein YZ31_07185 [Campylobacter lari]|nr:hypothetical protein [Campylobacter lari]
MKNKFWKEKIENYKDDEKILISSFDEFKEFLKNFLDYEISFQRSGCQKEKYECVDVYDFFDLLFDSNENIFTNKCAEFYFRNGARLNINYVDNVSIKDSQEILYEVFKNLDSLLKEYQEIHFYRFNDKEIFFKEEPKLKMKLEWSC